MEAKTEVSRYDICKGILKARQHNTKREIEILEFIQTQLKGFKRKDCNIYLERFLNERLETEYGVARIIPNWGLNNEEKKWGNVCVRLSKSDYTFSSRKYLRIFIEGGREWSDYQKAVVHKRIDMQLEANSLQELTTNIESTILYKNERIEQLTPVSKSLRRLVNDYERLTSNMKTFNNGVPSDLYSQLHVGGY